MKIPATRIQEQIGAHQQNRKRAFQLRAIIEKYRTNYSGSVKVLYTPTTKPSSKIVMGYDSDLSNFLKNKFGLEVVFHGKDGRDPYGYTVIDHATKNILKGGEIMPLKIFIQSNEKIQSSEKKLVPENEVQQQKSTIHTSTKEFQEEVIAEKNFELNISNDVDDEKVYGRNRSKEKKLKIHSR